MWEDVCHAGIRAPTPDVAAEEAEEQWRREERTDRRYADTRSTGVQLQVTGLRVPMSDVFVFVLQASIASAIIGLIGWVPVLLSLAVVVT